MKTLSFAVLPILCTSISIEHDKVFNVLPTELNITKSRVALDSQGGIIGSLKRVSLNSTDGEVLADVFEEKLLDVTPATLDIGKTGDNYLFLNAGTEERRGAIFHLPSKNSTIEAAEDVAEAHAILADWNETDLVGLSGESRFELSQIKLPNVTLTQEKPFANAHSVNIKPNEVVAVGADQVVDFKSGDVGEDTHASRSILFRRAGRIKDGDIEAAYKREERKEVTNDAGPVKLDLDISNILGVTFVSEDDPLVQYFESANLPPIAKASLIRGAYDVLAKATSI